MVAGDSQSWRLILSDVCDPGAVGSVASAEPAWWRSIPAEDAGPVRRLRAARPQADRSAFAGFRFPREVIAVAVRWYLRYELSYRDVEELLAERSVQVDHVTIYRWVQRFTPLFADAARPLRHATGDRWFVDETYIKVASQWRYLYRAVDQYGQVVDVLLSEQRDTAAARRFFARALRHGPAPVEVTTDQGGPYLRVIDHRPAEPLDYAGAAWEEQRQPHPQVVGDLVEVPGRVAEPEVRGPAGGRTG
jgi:transposase-like protein